MDHLDTSMDGDEERSGFRNFSAKIGKVCSSYRMLYFYVFQRYKNIASCYYDLSNSFEIFWNFE